MKTVETEVETGSRASNVSLISPLTSARFFAAMMVVLFHTFPNTSDESRIEKIYILLFSYGHAAVGFFFILSGFILAKVYPALSGAAAVKRFFVARFARIYPLFFLCLVADVHRILFYRIAKFGFGLGFAMTGASFILEASMISALIPDVAVIDGPSWSIPTETCFYIFFPFIITAPGRLLGRHESIKIFLLQLLLLYILVLLPPLAVYYFYQNIPYWAEILVGRNPIFRVPEFVIGVMLARQTAVSSWTSGPFSGWLLLFGAIGAAAVISVNQISFHPVQSALLVPFFAMMIVGLANSKNIVTKVMSNSLLVLLGEASFALYLIHMPIWQGLELEKRPLNSAAYLSFLLAIIGVSIALHLAVERPSRIWIRKKFSEYTRSQTRIVEGSR
jgi:peptidoglycan/LPS O-acetylase OafA/YrhL